MIELLRQTDDSAQFIDLAQRLVNSAVHSSAVVRVYVVKIDKWFPAKWCQFSGKQYGAIGIWKDRLTLPPFVPSRVVSEVCHDISQGKSGDGQLRPDKPVHLRQASAENLRRFVDRFDSGAAFFWYSGSTAYLGKGCLMAYVPECDGYRTWYVEIHADEKTRLGLLRGISKQELAGYAATSSASF